MSRDPEVRERQRRALELRLAGATFDVIATELGYAHHTGAQQAVAAALRDRIVPDADVVTTELARLDAMLLGLWTQARKGNVNAVDRVLKISERRMQLLALAPEQPASGPTDEGDPVDELDARRRAARDDDIPAATNQ